MFQGPKGYKVKFTCDMETVQQNSRFPLFSSKFQSNIYSILFDYWTFKQTNWKTEITTLYVQKV